MCWRSTRTGSRYIMVDEYQDTNHAQYRLVSLLAGEVPQPLRSG